MPWTTSQVEKHNHKVKSPKRKRQWVKVANSVLKRTGDDGQAIRAANAAVKKSGRKKAHHHKKVSKK